MTNIEGLEPSFTEILIAMDAEEELPRYVQEVQSNTPSAVHILELMCDAIWRLKEDIENPSIDETTWTTPWRVFDYPVVWNADFNAFATSKFVIEALQTRTSPISTVDRVGRLKAAAYKHAEFILLGLLTNYVSLWRESENDEWEQQWSEGYDALLEEFLKDKPEDEREKTEDEFWQYLFRPFTLGFMGTMPLDQAESSSLGQIRNIPPLSFTLNHDEEQYNGVVLVEIHPLVADMSTLKGRFPVVTGIAIWKESNPPAATEDLLWRPAPPEIATLAESDKVSFWDAIFSELTELLNRAISNLSLKANTALPEALNQEHETTPVETAINSFIDESKGEKYQSIDAHIDKLLPDTYSPYTLKDIANRLQEPGEKPRTVYDRVHGNADRMLKDGLIRPINETQYVLHLSGEDARKVGRRVEKNKFRKKNSLETH